MQKGKFFAVKMFALAVFTGITLFATGGYGSETYKFLSIVIDALYTNKGITAVAVGYPDNKIRIFATASSFPKNTSGQYELVIDGEVRYISRIVYLGNSVAELFTSKTRTSVKGSSPLIDRGYENADIQQRFYTTREVFHIRSLTKEPKTYQVIGEYTWKNSSDPSGAINGFLAAIPLPLEYGNYGFLDDKSHRLFIPVGSLRGQTVTFPDGREINELSTLVEVKYH